ncbi:hypothetical protein ACJJTC_006769 [Scirpophaga incertulas]
MHSIYSSSVRSCEIIGTTSQEPIGADAHSVCSPLEACIGSTHSAAHAPTNVSCRRGASGVAQFGRKPEHLPKYYPQKSGTTIRYEPELNYSPALQMSAKNERNPFIPNCASEKISDFDHANR